MRPERDTIWFQYHSDWGCEFHNNISQSQPTNNDQLNIDLHVGNLTP